MSMEKIKVTTKHEDICNMMGANDEGYCTAFVLTDDTGMAYVLSLNDNINNFASCKSAEECKNYGNGRVIPLNEILEDSYEYELLEGNQHTVRIVNDDNEYTDGKRHFVFGVLSYDEITTKCSTEIDYSAINSFVYADCLEEAVDLALEHMFEQIIEGENMAFLPDLDDMTVISNVHDKYGLYENRGEVIIDECGNVVKDNVEPYYIYLPNDNNNTLNSELPCGIKRTENDTLEYYRFLKDDKDPRGFKTVLVRTDYFAQIKEYVYAPVE